MTGEGARAAAAGPDGVKLKVNEDADAEEDGEERVGTTAGDDDVLRGAAGRGMGAFAFALDGRGIWIGSVLTGEAVDGDDLGNGTPPPVPSENEGRTWTFNLSGGKP
jgi:hypothetical protein